MRYILAQLVDSEELKSLSPAELQRMLADLDAEVIEADDPDESVTNSDNPDKSVTNS